MISKNLTTTLVLTIEEVELYETRNHAGKFITKGPLKIFFVAEYNCYMMHINDFNYTLSKEIPVLSKPSAGYPQYVFPNLDGFYVIKITQMACFEALGFLENLLADQCTLAHEKEPSEVNREQNLQAKAADQRKPNEIKPWLNDKEIETVKPIDRVQELKGATKNSNSEVASTMIATGGEFARASIIKGAEMVSSGISSLANYLKVNYINKSKEIDLSQSSINKVKIVHTASKNFESFTNRQVDAVVKKGRAISMAVTRQATNTNVGKKIGSYEQTHAIVEVGKSTLHAVGCVYEGMFEAITIIGMGLGNDAKEIVEHRYGEKAGTAFKYGFETLANFSIKDVIRRQMIKAMKKTEPEPLKQ